MEKYVVGGASSVTTQRIFENAVFGVTDAAAEEASYTEIGERELPEMFGRDPVLWRRYIQGEGLMIGTKRVCFATPVPDVHSFLALKRADIDRFKSAGNELYFHKSIFAEVHPRRETKFGREGYDKGLEYIGSCVARWLKSCPVDRTSRFLTVCYHEGNSLFFLMSHELNTFDGFGVEEDEGAPSEQDGDVFARLPSKEIPGFSQGIKELYRVLGRSVHARYPQKPPLEIMMDIKRIERECHYSFFQSQYLAKPGTVTWKMYRRRALAAYHALGLTDEAQEEERRRYHEEVTLLIDLVARETGDTLEEVKANYEDLASIGGRIGIETYAQLQEILIQGAAVEGFDQTRDFSLPNERIHEILIEIFGLRMYRNAKIARISKGDEYLLYRNANNETHILEGNELIDRGLVKAKQNFLVAPNKESYLEAEQFLEGVASVGELKHLYKLRADVSSFKGFNVIALKSFEIEQAADYDYLADLEGLSEEQKMRLYMLSTIVHEFAHVYELNLLTEEKFDEYKRIIQEERASELREKYVSAYVLRHDELYQSTEHGLAREDIAEAVRIYTVNPGYLESYFPRRAAFIATHLSFVVRDGLTQALQKIVS